MANSGDRRPWYLDLLEPRYLYANLTARYLVVLLSVTVVAAMVYFAFTKPREAAERVEQARELAGFESLSPSTKEFLSELPGEVTITYFASRTLPLADLQEADRDVRHLLAAFKLAGRGRVVSRIVYPEERPALEAEATMAGVQPITFNAFSERDSGSMTAWMGATVVYGTKTESMGLRNVKGLEYRLAGAIRRATGSPAGLSPRSSE